jgi:hypothetical protein
LQFLRLVSAFGEWDWSLGISCIGPVYHQDNIIHRASVLELVRMMPSGVGMIARAGILHGQITPNCSEFRRTTR